MSEDHTSHSPQQVAQEAGLRYVGDTDPGIGRRRCGRGFSYRDPHDRPVRGRELLRRIEALAIPPAWQEVWICGDPQGHLQATGRDQRGRKQYLYHPDWQQAAARIKFDRLRLFGQSLPRLRRRLAACVQQRQATERRGAAAILLLMDHTAIRVGNEEYVRQNGSYGLSTLRHKHLRESGAALELRFVAKGGTRRVVEVRQPSLVRLLQQYRSLPGRHLFQYRASGGELHPIDSELVNEVLRNLARLEVTAKDFRTWKASALVAGRLFDDCRSDAPPPPRRAISAAVTAAAQMLGNTTTVCRNSYIHPALLDRFAAGRFAESCGRRRPRRSKWMSRDERILLSFLETID